MQITLVPRDLRARQHRERLYFISIFTASSEAGSARSICTRPGTKCWCTRSCGGKVRASARLHACCTVASYPGRSRSTLAVGSQAQGHGWGMVEGGMILTKSYPPRLLGFWAEKIDAFTL